MSSLSLFLSFLSHSISSPVQVLLFLALNFDPHLSLSLSLSPPHSSGCQHHHLLFLLLSACLLFSIDTFRLIDCSNVCVLAVLQLISGESSNILRRERENFSLMAVQEFLCSRRSIANQSFAKERRNCGTSGAHRCTNSNSSFSFLISFFAFHIDNFPHLLSALLFLLIVIC